MDIRQPVNKRDFKFYDTKRIREEFLIDGLFRPGEIRLTYSHIDRIIAGSAAPGVGGLSLSAGEELRCSYFLERREMGAINIGGPGRIVADGVTYSVQKYDCLYLGRGTKDVVFFSESEENPAQFWLNSSPAHREFPTALCRREDAVSVRLGSRAECNERTIYKYILPAKLASCQLVMGLTKLEEGSVWNTMPSHTHERRMEVYLYFDLKPDQAVFHFMGDPSETRHLVLTEKQAVISPSFSIHSGCGTAAYTFIWGMCGENQDFDDMDGVRTVDLK